MSLPHQRTESPRWSFSYRLREGRNQDAIIAFKLEPKMDGDKVCVAVRFSGCAQGIIPGVSVGLAQDQSVAQIPATVLDAVHVVRCVIALEL